MQEVHIPAKGKRTIMAFAQNLFRIHYIFGSQMGQRIPQCIGQPKEELGITSHTRKRLKQKVSALSYPILSLTLKYWEEKEDVIFLTISCEGKKRKILQTEDQFPEQLQMGKKIQSKNSSGRGRSWGWSGKKEEKTPENSLCEWNNWQYRQLMLTLQSEDFPMQSGQPWIFPDSGYRSNSFTWLELTFCSTAVISRVALI